MNRPDRKKNNSRRLIFLVLTTLICSSPNSSAIAIITAESSLPSHELYSHYHQNEQLQPIPRQDTVEQHESLRLDVTGARLACSEDDCSHHHHGCDLEITYRLSAQMQTELSLGAQVVCQARIDYLTSHGYHLRSERCSSPAEHIFHQRNHIDSTIVVKFQFSPYEQVIDAQVGSIQCRIEQAELIFESSLH